MHACFWTKLTCTSYGGLSFRKQIPSCVLTIVWTAAPVIPSQMRRIFVAHGWKTEEVYILGHALEGNIHIIFAQPNLGSPENARKFDALPGRPRPRPPTSWPGPRP